MATETNNGSNPEMPDKSKMINALIAKQRSAIELLPGVPEHAKNKVLKNIRKRARKIERLENVDRTECETT